MKTAILTSLLVCLSFTWLQAQTTVIWGVGSGDATQESIAEFDGGFNGWQAISISDDNGPGGTALWTHNTTGQPQGAYYSVANHGVLTSPSAANGAALFDSDFLDNGGTAGAFGTGASPGPHVAALVSPAIDLTGNSNVLLKYHSYYRRFTPTSVFVGVSVDGGTTWTDFQAVENIPAVNALATNTTQYVDISPALAGAASLSSVRLRFLFDGNYYFWMVDDLSIIEKPSNNLAFAGKEDGNTLGDAFTRTQASSSFYTPETQVDARLFGLGARIQNLGTAQDNGAYILFNINYEDENGNVVISDFRDSVSFNLAPGTDTIVTIPGTYEPTTPGVYTASYTLVSGGSDPLQYNNVDTQTFVISPVSENWLSKVPRAADGGPASTRSILAAEATGETLTDFEYGNMFFIKSATTPTGVRSVDSMYYRPVNFDDAPVVMDGQVVTVILYEWVDADQDGRIPEDHSAAIGTELIITAVASDTLPVGIQDGDLRGVELNDAINIVNPGPVFLKDSTIYLATIRNSNANGVFVGMRAHANLNYSLNVQTNADDGIDLWPAPTRTRFTDVNGNPTNPNFPAGRWNNVGYGADITPSIALHLVEAPTSVIRTEEKLSNLRLFPNPTSNIVNVEYQGEAAEVVYTIVDMQGRILQTEIRNNVSDDLFSYDASALPAGMYLVNVRSEAGVRTLSFVVK